MEDADPGSTGKKHFLALIKSLLGLGVWTMDAEQKEQEIRKAVTEGQEQGILQETEADMISNVFEFFDKEAKDIMTNRGEIAALDGNMTLAEAVAFLTEANNSRFPVFIDTIDHIIGILHIRDVLKVQVEGNRDQTPIRRIQGLLRQPVFVPETRNIDALFRSMQASKTQIVIVIDEYGQTCGLVSMEDILEEIVGNIFDEYDEDEEYIRAGSNENEFIMDGKTPLELLRDRFGLKLEDEDCETLNGLLISKLDHIPADDEKFECVTEGYSFQLLTVSNHMIQSVLVRKLSEDETKEEDNAEGAPGGE